jgi:hypothetical protein
MIGWKNAVTVRKDKVRGRAGTHAVISAKCHPKSAMSVRDEIEGKFSRSGKSSHDIWRAVIRPIVGDDDFESSAYALLK